MKIRNKVAALGVIASSFLGMSVLAYQFDSGALMDTSANEDKVSFGFGKTFSQTRLEVDVPSGYGHLVHMTDADGKTVLWFENADGALRNVPVNASIPLIIRRKGDLTN